MFRTKFRVLRSHGIQYIRRLDEAVLPEIFRGRPVLTDPAALPAAACPGTAGTDGAPDRTDGNKDTATAPGGTLPGTAGETGTGCGERTTPGTNGRPDGIGRGDRAGSGMEGMPHGMAGEHYQEYRIARAECVAAPTGYRAGTEAELAEAVALERLCPTGAITASPFSLDLGRCLFCGECARRAPHLVRFTNDYRMGAGRREDLVVTPATTAIGLDPALVRREITRTFGRALKLREVCAGGEGSTEMELNASMNVNFDFGRYGIDFTASPRHADGLVLTGPVTGNMARALELCYEAMPEPRLLIVAGADAISGGLFAGSPAVDRRFLDRVTPDLYLPGNPVHPLTFIHGVMALTGRPFRKKRIRR